MLDWRVSAEKCEKVAADLVASILDLLFWNNRVCYSTSVVKINNVLIMSVGSENKAFGCKTKRDISDKLLGAVSIKLSLKVCRHFIEIQVFKLQRSSLVLVL